MKNSLTRSLAELIANKPIKADDLEVSALFLLDAVANMLAGQNSTQGQKLLAWAKSIATNGDLNQLDSGRKSFLLGALCHILELDDLHRASVVHPGCVVGPAALVLGLQQNGKEVLSAFLRGVEATTRLGMSVGPEHYKIWHNTATCGPFGSAVCAAELLKLNIDQTVHGLGNAGSQASGFWEFLETGAETKHMHAGRGAEAGVIAAQLALNGFSGAPKILEGERGFFAGTCTNPPIERLLEKPEDPWQIHQASIKPWPSCRHTHPAIELGISLFKKMDEQNLSLGDIKSIQVSTYQATLDLCNQPRPQSIYAAKFSIQHCIAAALADGKVDLNSFDEPTRSRLAPLLQKVSILTDDALQSAYPNQWGAKISLGFNNGETFYLMTNNAYGDPESRLDRWAMIEKANMLFKHAGFQNGDGLIETILTMPQGSPCPDIIALLDPSK